MKYFSTFTGVGGFEIALNKFDWTCVGVSEIDKYASSVLEYRFPEIKNYGDITQIEPETLPDFEVLVGGSPCQSFSFAGDRTGLKGKSGLFTYCVKILEAKQPRYFIWENVKGVLSSNGGSDFSAILLAFSEAGYDVKWGVYNAADFGVPQNRERVIIIGHNRREREFGPIYYKRESVVRSDRAGCLQARYPGSQREGTYINKGGETRILTPIECERLMSWPDDWTKYMSGGRLTPLTQRYKMCGNGVVSKMIEELVRLNKFH